MNGLCFLDQRGKVHSSNHNLKLSLKNFCTLKQTNGEKVTHGVGENICSSYVW